MSIPHDPIYGRLYLLAIAPDAFHNAFPEVREPPFRECSLNDLYKHYAVTRTDNRLTVPQDEMETYYKANGWAMYCLGEGGNLLRIV